ncbi:12037_t:CDS:2 [Funneliformis caledonium]|uniref:12037_t:CDS:1 n=1 Tax=Funneliformis caledonium TaxID=1117310 RepID=A0A9N9G7J5_9GLOM|nr:12037_t:CDS:2 [Funneliformis caledonium]
MDEQYKTVEEALESLRFDHVYEGFGSIENAMAEGIVNFLQTENEHLNGTLKMVYKSQLNFLERNEAKKSRIDEQEKEAEDVNKNESVANNRLYNLRGKGNINYNEGYLSKEQCRYTTPSPGSPTLHLLPMDNSEDEDKDEDGVIIINDVNELCFKDGNPENDLKIGDTNVSQLFRKYQNESVKIAKTEGLFVESNIHKILPLSSIFLLASGSHSNTMINIFSSLLLNEVHQQIASAQQIELSLECESKFRKVIKQVTRKLRHKAIKLLLTELSNDEILDENLGFCDIERPENVA